MRPKQCDEERPECRRCINIALPCPGYRPENELVFLDMNQCIEHKVLTACEKQRGPRSHAQNSSVAFRAYDPSSAYNENIQTQSSLDRTPESSTELVKNPTGPILYKSLSTDWQDRSLCRFFSDYVINTDDLKASPGFLHNIPRLFNRTTSKESVLRQAVTAVALSNFSNQVGSEDLLIKARKCYGRGLVELHRALSEGRLKSDDTLGGCLMLNMYEVRSCTLASQNSSNYMADVQRRQTFEVCLGNPRRCSRNATTDAGHFITVHLPRMWWDFPRRTSSHSQHSLLHHNLDHALT
jgi:hypothetical protein